MLNIRITSELKFILLILFFIVYLGMKMHIEFRYCFLIDKMILVLITAVGYNLGINIYWLAAFFFTFMSILIWNDFTQFLKPSSFGKKIDIIHEYDVNPDKKHDKIKNAVIPLHIYQTWHTKKMPPKMKECVESLKKQNPEFTHHLFDIDECREYIRSHFDEDVLNAYDKLIPSAYKADLWRYCVLYKEGGIYMDIKFKCDPNFKLIELVDKEHFVLDRPYTKNISLKDEIAWLNSPEYAMSAYTNIDSEIWENGIIGIYNAFLVCKKNNPYLKECIDNVVKNTKNKYYGHNSLYPTGPGLMGNIYFKDGKREKIHDFELFNSLNGNYILSRNKKILYHYPEYRDEQAQTGAPKYYKMWENRTMYKD